MLKRQFRLSNFKRTNGERSIASPLFALRFWENRENNLKFGFVVSKKIDKRAVVRNRIKRRLSKSIEELFGKISPGYNFIFIARKEILEKSQSEVAIYIEEIFKKNKFIK